MDLIALCSQKMKFLVCTTLLLVACGPKHRQGDPPKPKPTSLEPDAGAVITPNLSSEQCQALFNHLIDLKSAHQRNTLPPEQHPTEAYIAQAKQAMISGSALTECTSSRPEDVNYDCAIAAKDAAEFTTCLGQE